MGMFCTECAEKNYVFHKRKKRRGKIRFLCIDRAGWEILLTVEKQEEGEKSKNASEMLKKISAEVVRT